MNTDDLMNPTEQTRKNLDVLDAALATIDEHIARVPRETSAASWFTMTRLGAVPGSVVATNGKTWGFCKIRIDYRAGGYQVAIVPMWLAGFLSMSRLIKGVTGPASTAAVMFGRFWSRGQAEGWIKIESFESAAEQRSREMMQDQPVKYFQFNRPRASRMKARTA